MTGPSGSDRRANEPNVSEPMWLDPLPEGDADGDVQVASPPGEPAETGG